MEDSTQGEPSGILLFASTADEASPAAPPNLRQQVERHFAEHREHLYFYLLACGASSVDADDLTQDSFIRLYKHLRSGNRVERLKPWLFKVARNLLLDRRKKSQHEAPADGGLWNVWAETIVDPAADPGRAALGAERQALIERAFQALTPLQVQYLHLRADGLRHREIAEIYSVAVSTVAGTIRRAVERLGKEVE